MLSIGEFFEVSPENVQKFDYETIKLNDKYCYALMIDYEISDRVRMLDFVH